MASATRPVGPVRALRSRLDHHLTYSLGRTWKDASPREAANAAALAIRQHIIDRLLDTERRYEEADAKRVYYLSIEFLLGRALGNNLHNLGQYDAWRQTAKLCGLDFDAMLEAEPEPALGNGGVGRLAACVLDSMATLGLPGVGYGINYEYGLFRQRIDDGHQAPLRRGCWNEPMRWCSCPRTAAWPSRTKATCTSGGRSGSTGS
jgi:starch phosphorylase